MKKTVVITGASSGFGKETSELFQSKGWNVAATMRSPEKEHGLTQSDSMLITRLDVQDRASIKAAFDTIVNKYGRVDAIVNNAGYGLMGVFESATPEQIRRLYDVNVFGAMDVTQAALPYLRAQGGAIINISSFGGYVSLPFGSLYNSSKFALEGFSEALAHELYKFDIAVKIIEPGSVSTNFRSSAQMVKNEIVEYNPLMASLFANYAEATKHLSKATPVDVANTIYGAVTDGKAQLRYVVGADAQFYVDIKNNNSDQEFIKKMRSLFVW
jgi:NAD(P)-dependent dehydrogenase (short-subunit alcohol dehydrogenase family)